ncbi:uncharacterized protein Pp2C1 [Ochlerotatus camptorhynchus]|uniref:uncharacterized protein Pp2C1 n=1 Tax=Ochlerotatus camptorhynchus TaxID=644619 RepID=UPI0031E3AF91
MSIGINLRVTGHTSIGGRKYQEDFFSVAYQQTENDQSLEYAFFGIYDGHGGAEASLYAREHLMKTIVSQKLFWSENDEDVLKAIRDGYIQTHYSMWREQDKWPKTSSGLPSTAGTTASIAFIRRGKIYIGHVGDSGIVLGYQKDKEAHTGESCTWNAMPLTEDHKPEAYAEKMRIMSCGGKVVTKSGVPRVVWNRPRIGHKGPVRRSTPIDEIPFLAVARSLGDLWSYNSAVDEFIVSPNPDVSVVEIDPKRYRCLIFGTDGLWNVLSPKHAVEIVHAAEMENIRIALEGGCDWKNPSKLLVNEALERWSKSNMKADNTSVVIIMLDPPGPPKRDVLRSMRTSIQPIDHKITNTQTLDKLNVTLYDHTTRELVDLSQVTCQDASQVVQANVQHQQHYLDSTPSASYQDMAYTDSFAESYNTFLNSSLSNDHSYTNYTPSAQHYSVHHQHHHQHHHLQHQSQQHNVLHEENLQYPAEGQERNQQDSAEETYLLTNLQTKSERLQSEMMEASTSTASTSAVGYLHMECTGNVAIIENFHDYQSPHLPSHTAGHQTPFSSQYPHHSFQQHQHHHHHEHATYQMERYDYHHSHPHEPAGCSYGSQQYTAHDLSENNYPKDSEEYLYPEEELDSNRQDSDTIQETLGVVELTINNNENDTEETVPESIDERPSVINASKGDSKSDVEDIQINEISSSNLSALSPAQDTSLQSDSDSCLSGDEAKASSSTSRSPSNTMDKRSSARVGKAKKVRKTIKNIVKIVYETRSSQRPHRTRAQQENLSTAAASRNMRSKFGNFLPKQSKVKKFLSFKKVKKSIRCSLADANSGTVSNNNNNINNKNIDVKSKAESDVGKPEERRVLRSADQMKAGKPSQRFSRRAVESITLISSTSQPSVPKRSVTLVTERKLPKRKMLLRKVALDAKRVKRH